MLEINIGTMSAGDLHPSTCEKACLYGKGIANVKRMRRQFSGFKTLASLRVLGDRGPGYMPHVLSDPCSHSE